MPTLYQSLPIITNLYNQIVIYGIETTLVVVVLMRKPAKISTEARSNPEADHVVAMMCDICSLVFIARSDRRGSR